MGSSISVLGIYGVELSSSSSMDPGILTASPFPLFVAVGFGLFTVSPPPLFVFISG